MKIIVHNTFSRYWEMENYIHHAQKKDWKYTVYDLFDSGLTDKRLAERCIHGVDVEGIKRMRVELINHQNYFYPAGLTSSSRRFVGINT